MRLIDADAFLERVLPECKYPDILKEAVENQPTIEAEPVRHGRWIVRGQDIYCSECNDESLYNPFGASKFSDFCPNCGAKMDGGAENG